MSDEFNAHIFEGVFGTLEADGVIQHWVRTDAGEDRRVDQVLADLVGRVVQVAAHHIPHPPTPPDPKQWKNLVAMGQLGHDPERGLFAVTGFDGTTTVLNLMDFCGHSARVLVATTDAVEMARDIVINEGLTDRVEGLGQEAAALQSLLSSLNKIVDESKKA